jgi:uncharacterized protein YifN (PemK superfamily)
MLNRTMSSETSGTMQNMRNNQSMWRSCGVVLAVGRARLRFVVSEDGTRNGMETVSE